MDVCILAAGRGTRVDSVGQGLHKSLLPIQRKAAISHVIERFPTETRFIVAVGHLSDQIRDYLRLAHPGSRIEYIDVRPYEGAGSGPGTSALCCEPKLPGPFFLACSDTYWPETTRFAVAPAENTAWTGRVSREEEREYCNLKVEGGRVVSLHDKVEAGPGSQAWVGLVFIRDRDVFFSGIRGSSALKGEHQISSGLKDVIAEGALTAQTLPGWLDLGTSARYARARQLLDPPGFDKEGEFFFHVGDRVLKFFNDPEIVRNRVARAGLRPNLFPEILGAGSHLYCYRFVPGQTLYDHPDPPVLQDLLSWMSSSVWSRLARAPADFKSQCLAFYRTRTLVRVAAAEPELDRERDINVQTLLAAAPWDQLIEGVPAFIHGDLQLDNVVVSPERSRFRLIDWRQDFAGALEYGDLYYDFAKLLASIDLDFRAVARGEFELRRKGDRLHVSAASTVGAPMLRGLVEQAAVRDHGLDLRKLRLLVGLVYLNMSGLHLGDQSRLLYHLGSLRLAEALSDESYFRKISLEMTV